MEVKHSSTRGVLTGRRFSDAKSLLDTPAQGKLLSMKETEHLVREQLSDYFTDQITVRFGDNQYYLPTQDEVEFILTESNLERKRFMPERFDCDDYAFILKGEISQHAYQAGQLRSGLCAGIVWGHFNWNQRGYHAVNWYLDASEALYFIEPQWDMFFESANAQKGIDLLLA